MMICQCGGRLEFYYTMASVAELYLLWCCVVCVVHAWDSAHKTNKICFLCSQFEAPLLSDLTNISAIQGVGTNRATVFVQEHRQGNELLNTFLRIIN